MNLSPRVHDILGPLNPDAVIADTPAERSLIQACLQQSPYAVVRRIARRAAPHNNQIPIGIRGLARNQRYAAWLASGHLPPITRPEDLRATTATQPALETLLLLQHRWSCLELSWGPTGSVGFALATNAPTVSPTSDLDLLLQAPTPLSTERARLLLADTQHLPSRVDVQIETPLGAIALEELVHNPTKVLLRSSTGAMLTSTSELFLPLGGIRGLLAPDHRPLYKEASAPDPAEAA